ncbi:unnamed protein product, partial [marine sediment metagenome]
LFINSWIVDKPLSFALLLWLRDCRGGAGNRSGSRAIYNWIAKNNPEWLKANLHQLPTVGRWDDLRSLFDTPLEVNAAEFWANAIVPSNDSAPAVSSEPNILAAKWANRSDHPIRLALGNISVPELRKLLAAIRQNHIVEHKMCQKLWDQIKYKTVPSVAMSRYTKAFKKHDDERFQAFKNKVKTGEEKVHAEVLFPHDCIRTCLHGDREMAELQFNALPNFLEGEDGNERIMVLSDTSGSMDTNIGGSVRAVDVSTGLALYCSSRMREDSPFYKRFIGFCSEGTFKDWRNLSFSEALKSRRIFDGAIGATRIDKAMDLILHTAVKREISQDLMPTTLLIVSDMQFHSGGSSNDDTEIEACLKKWNEAGYESPKVVYWNTAGYSGQQATEGMKNVGMISGFSPSILKTVLGGTDFSPIAIMLRTLEKYEVAIPELRDEAEDAS